MGHGFYRSKDPTNSIKVLKEQRKTQKTQKQNTQIRNSHAEKIHTTHKSPLVYTNMKWLGGSSHLP